MKRKVLSFLSVFVCICGICSTAQASWRITPAKMTKEEWYLVNCARFCQICKEACVQDPYAVSVCIDGFVYACRKNEKALVSALFKAVPDIVMGKGMAKAKAEGVTIPDVQSYFKSKK
jgi:hypothetical protein